MLVLASASPRRRELLAQAGFRFEAESSDVPEVRAPGEEPVPFVLRLAREKAHFVHQKRRFRHNSEPQAEQHDTGLLVLGADTVVVTEGEVLGKPASADDAHRMLRLLSGRTHQVITGLCLESEDAVETAAEITYVSMQTLSDREIADYIATGEPFDKAGSYAIQGRAARWIPRIHGCYFNVVGLPLALASSMIEAMERRASSHLPSHPEHVS